MLMKPACLTLTIALLLSIPAVVKANVNELLIFPQPKELTLTRGIPFQISQETAIVLREGADEREISAAREIVSLVLDISGWRLSVRDIDDEQPAQNTIYIGKPAEYPVMGKILSEHNIAVDNNTPGREGYVVLVTPDNICIAGSDIDGTYWGIQTLLAIIRQCPSLEIPALTITDYPDIKYRGLFNECHNATDRMTLDDYKQMIDFLAAHKYNSLAVGIYGCWGDTDKRSHKGRLEEFFFVPVPQLPKLVSPQEMEYFSPRRSKWHRIAYIPTMFEEDLFGQIIEYGKQKHIRVYPKLNSFGHNTLIPRMYPEVAARDENGNSIEYGFRVTSEKTYEILFTIYDHIIDTYLTPNGIDQFDIQLDEARGWDATDMEQLGSHEAIFKQHMVRIAKHLKSKGMKHIGMWDDMLGRNLDGKNHIDADFMELLRKEKLDDVLIIQWWWYRQFAERKIRYFPDEFRSDVGFRSWVVPMTGLTYPFQFRYGQTHLVNVFDMMSHGKAQKIEGSESYYMYDPRHHKNDIALADFSWNLPDEEDRWKIDAFLEKYSRRYFGSRWQGAYATFRNMRTFYDTYSQQQMHVLPHDVYALVPKPYEHKRPYPEEAFNRLQRDANNREQLIKAAGDAGLIHAFFKNSLNVPGVDQTVVRPLYANFSRAHNLAQEFVLLYEIDDLYSALRKVSQQQEILAAIAKRLSTIRSLQLEAMETWEHNQPDFTHPRDLRAMSFMLHFVDERLASIGEWQRALTEGRPLDLPEKFITGTIHEL
jgi:hypothetical protein